MAKHYSFQPVRSEPRPIQKPHPPIWVGGHEPPALRRAARYGDGWHAYRLNPDEVSEKAAYVKVKAAEYGRDPASIAISVRAPLIISDKSLSIDRAFSGTADDLKRQVSDYARLGVECIVFEPPLLEGIDIAIKACDRFAKEVAPAFI